ncbi:hypothetical protein IQ06DRAFT_10513 [Phaeosphaeriaceae sp. SRC1lsM3a]|nr:hypothetical protein IQ06DRAFT_10513 [Stagonospora sp. SRC1lsM3a]
MTHKLAVVEDSMQNLQHPLRRPLLMDLMYQLEPCQGPAVFLSHASLNQTGADRIYALVSSTSDHTNSVCWTTRSGCAGPVWFLVGFTAVLCVLYIV